MKGTVSEFTFIKSEKKLIKIRFDAIILIRGLGNYIEIITTGKRFLYYKSLKAVIDALPDYFMRVHNSYIINLSHVEGLEDNNLLMRNNHVPVGKNYRGCLASMLNKLML